MLGCGRVIKDRATNADRPQVHPVGLDGPQETVCRWDGATKSGSHSAGGMVIMNQAGEIIFANGVQFRMIYDPLVVEVLALREAVNWCRDHAFTVVRFEGDAKVFINKILLADAKDNRMGAILQEVIQCFASNPGFSVRFVGWDNNRVAHLEARKALSLYPSMSRVFDYQTWLNSRM
ncbi:unnamed protein product [Linum trigynum]|uniref:RNase H type-1 domain-containing protein n=1 Tax=Linum trigynum TaxID=586398 RepID=A0AAV2CWC2_9ROSI